MRPTRKFSLSVGKFSQDAQGVTNRDKDIHQ